MRQLARVSTPALRGSSVRDGARLLTTGEFRFRLSGCAGSPAASKRKPMRTRSKDESSSLIPDRTPTACNEARDRLLEEHAAHG